MNSPKSAQKTGGALKKTPSRHLSEPSTSQGGKTQVHKPEEDSRRRTIILEKKDGSFGFTIQSYGIHFKKEKEVEVITYVDSVAFNGSAARAGLREGDVILSINGMEVDKADHDTLVTFIQNCDSRMRMVVLFENCVRKVDLQRHALDIKREITERLEELTQLCLLEHEITKEKSKTHSLPFLKKQSQKLDMIDQESACVTVVENKMNEKKKSQSAHYIDDSRVIEASTKSKNDQKARKAPRPQSRCYPCYQPQNDSNIDAYDLASPCCEPRYFKCHHHEKSVHRVPHKGRILQSNIPKKKGRDVSSQTKPGQLDETFEIPSRTGSYRRYMGVDLDNTSTTSSKNTMHVFAESNTFSNGSLLSDDGSKAKNIVHQKKSCTNFTTKAFGGYGFGGYGFGSKNNPLKSTKSTNTDHHNHDGNNEKQRTHCAQKNKYPTKSTENLLVNAEYQDLTASNSSASYDCLHSIQSTFRQRDPEYREDVDIVKTPKYIRQHSHHSRQHVVLKSFRKRRSNSAEIMRS